MTDFNKPSNTENVLSWMSQLTLGAFMVVAVISAVVPQDAAARQAAAPQPVATTTLYGTIAADAQTVGDAQTVEMSIAAYDR